MNGIRLWVRALMVPVGAIWMLASGGANAAANSLTDRWQHFASVEGRFSVLMPEASEYTTVTRDFGVGQTTVYLFYVRTAIESYAVAYINLPASLDRNGVLKGVREGAVAAGTILTEVDTTINGHSARLITAKKPDGTLFTGAFFFVGSRMYQMMYMHSSGDPAKDLVNGMAFIRSFQLAH
jgi:hypothetical protein